MTSQQSEVLEEQSHWYVVHTYSGQEDRVQRNLENRIDSLDVRDRVYRVIVPTEDEIEIRSGQKRTVTRKVFPGYILVEMMMDDETWRVVRETPGVTGFVSSGDPPRPVPLDENEVRSILDQMEQEAPRVRVGYQKGQSVRITDGPFLDFIGTVEEVSPDRGKVVVMVSFFGRETPVELDFLQIEKL
ncbi:MAG: transcription termination/antitermination factor NusG [Dehalococcoidia bacterium]|nr:transcription termination/antitermination factor NusG [Dehalococcoidia bacterium]